MITVNGTIHRRDNDREGTSDYDEESTTSGENSAGRTRRSQTAGDRYGRSIRSRSKSRNLRQDRTNEPANTTIDEDRYRSRSISAGPKRSAIGDRIEDRRRHSKVSEDAAIVVDRHSKRTIDEVSGSRSVAKNDRSPKTMRFEDSVENQNEPEVLRSSEVCEEPAITEDQLSMREIGKDSGSKSVTGNDRRPRRIGFAERMLRHKLTSALRSASTKNPRLRDDRYSSFGAQKDLEMARSSIDRSPDVVASGQDSSTVVDLNVNTTDLITDENSNRNEIGEPKDHRLKELTIDESPSEGSCEDLASLFDKIDRALLNIDSASKLINTGESRSSDDPESKEPATDAYKIGDLGNDLTICNGIDEPLFEVVRPRKKRTEGSARIFGEDDLDQNVIDPRSESKDRDLSALNNYECTLGSEVADLKKPAAIEFAQKSTADSTISTSRRNLPIIRSDVIYPCGSVKLVSKIVKPSISTQISR